jgi:hypothetical protein
VFALLAGTGYPHYSFGISPSQAQNSYWNKNVGLNWSDESIPSPGFFRAKKTHFSL